MPLHYTHPTGSGFAEALITPAAFFTSLQHFIQEYPDYAYLKDSSLSPRQEAQSGTFQDRFIAWIQSNVDVPQTFSLIGWQNEPVSRLECLTKHFVAGYRREGDRSSNASVPRSTGSTNLSRNFLDHPSLVRSDRQDDSWGITFTWNDNLCSALMNSLRTTVDNEAISGNNPRTATDEALVKFLSVWLSIWHAELAVKDRADLYYEADQVGASRLFLAELANIFLRCSDNFHFGMDLSWDEASAPAWTTAQYEQSPAVADWVLRFQQKTLAFLEYKRSAVLTDSDMHHIALATRERINPREQGFKLYIEDGKLKAHPQAANVLLSQNAKKGCLQLWAEHWHYASPRGILHNGSSTLISNLKARSHVQLSNVIKASRDPARDDVNILSCMVGLALSLRDDGELSRLFTDETARTDAEHTLEELRQDGRERGEPTARAGQPSESGVGQTGASNNTARQTTERSTRRHNPSTSFPSPRSRRLQLRRFSLDLPLSQLKFSPLSAKLRPSRDLVGSYRLVLGKHASSGALWDVYRGTLHEIRPELTPATAILEIVSHPEPDGSNASSTNESGFEPVSMIPPDHRPIWETKRLPQKRSHESLNSTQSASTYAWSSSQSHTHSSPPTTASPLAPWMDSARPVVVKFSQPNSKAFRNEQLMVRMDDDSGRMTSEQAEAAIANEVRVLEKIRDLGIEDVVPRIYGIWVHERENGDLLYAMVQSDEGEAIMEGEWAWRSLSESERTAIIGKYSALHAQGIVHGDVKARHVVRAKEARRNDLRIIDFDQATLIDLSPPSGPVATAAQDKDKVELLREMIDEERRLLETLIGIPSGFWPYVV